MGLFDNKEPNNGDTIRTSHKTSDPINLTEESIYDFYARNLLPAVWASLPLLMARIGHDAKAILLLGWTKTVQFLLPWTKEDWSAPSLVTMWEQAMENSTVAEFMLSHFDNNRDGYISPKELLDMTEIMSSLRRTEESWLAWFSKSWPMMDWKFGVFVWRYFGGLLLVIMIASIVPGRLHGYSGRILRWPILMFVYFMIAVELLNYIVIRLFIKLAESLFASPKHRKLRRQMALAKSYEEWHGLARALDLSQGRDKWQCSIDDDTSYRYNWAFVKELMNDMRTARANRDSLLALAVLQQCTRKNVGGVMSEELFSYTYTGEPKHIVEEFVQEVVLTLKWVTDEAIRTSMPMESLDVPWSVETAAEEKEAYEKRLQIKVMQEKDKMWTSLISFATHHKGHKKERKRNPTIAKVASSSGMPKVASSSAMSNGTGRNDMSESENQHTQSQDSSPGMPTFHREHVVTFLKRARAAYGRSALCLSGGAMMGNYHFGHVKALLETDALPNIVSGTSAGSVVGAMLCTRTPEEIERDMQPEILQHKLKCFSRPWPDRLRSLYQNGHLFDYEEWLEMIKWMTCGDMTFEEAYQKTGRTFCITLSATTKKAPPVLVNHISAPNVVIASAIVASAAVPGLIPPVRLLVKDQNGCIKEQGAKKDELYWDGSIEQDIPMAGLAEMLNCQFFVAAQCNPHIVPFFYNSKGDVGRPSRWSSGRREDSWRGGFLLSALELYLKSDMRAKFHFLNDVEAAVRKAYGHVQLLSLVVEALTSSRKPFPSTQVGFTSTLMTQVYGGTTTIVPQATLIDYLRLFTNPSFSDLRRYFQGGSIAAYQHCAMIKLHYLIADALDECVEKLDNNLDSHPASVKPRTSLLRERIKTLKELDGDSGRRFSLPDTMSGAATNVNDDSVTSVSSSS